MLFFYTPAVRDVCTHRHNDTGDRTAANVKSGIHFKLMRGNF